MHELLGWRCTRLQAFIVEMSFRENCAATRARETSQLENSARRMDSRVAKCAMTRLPAPPPSNYVP